MGWRKVLVRILMSVAGALGVVLVMYVGLPWLLNLLEPVPVVPLADEEIVRQAIDSLAEQYPDEARDEEAAPEVQASEEDRAAALLATRENGETLPVVFPRPEGGTAEAVLPLRVPALERPAVQNAARPGAPVENAIPDRGAPAAQMDAVIPVAVPALEVPAMPEPPEERPPSEATLVAAAHHEGSVQVPEGPLAAARTADRGATSASPPRGAVRDVQELLERLGYEPGTVDGVWGPKTESAWRSFMQDAGTPPAPEASDPSLGPEEGAASGAAQAGTAPPGLPDLERSAAVPGTLRGVMGYRLPLVSRQEVPDQVVSGVLMPAHTTFVILRPGYWELTGLTPEDVRMLETSAARAKAEAAAARQAPVPVRRGWNPFRRFRRGE